MFLSSCFKSFPKKSLRLCHCTVCVILPSFLNVIGLPSLSIEDSHSLWTFLAEFIQVSKLFTLHVKEYAVTFCYDDFSSSKLVLGKWLFLKPHTECKFIISPPPKQTKTNLQNLCVRLELSQKGTLPRLPHFSWFLLVFGYWSPIETEHLTRNSTDQTWQRILICTQLFCGSSVRENLS